MNFFPEDILAGTALVLSAALIPVALATFSRLRESRVLLPAEASATVLVISLWLVLSRPLGVPGPDVLYIPLSACMAIIMTSIYVYWLTRKNPTGVSKGGKV